MPCEIKFDVFYPAPATVTSDSDTNSTNDLEQALMSLNLAEYREPDFTCLGAQLAMFKGITELPRTPVFIKSTYQEDSNDEQCDELSMADATVGSDDERDQPELHVEANEDNNFHIILDDINTFHEFKIKATNVPVMHKEYEEIAAGTRRICGFVLQILDCIRRESFTKRQKSEKKRQMHAIHTCLQKVLDQDKL